MRKILTVALLALALPVHAFDLQGHRGARGLAPENTLPAFARAAEIGVATLELDTGITKDGVVVVAHDRRLNPDITRDANGNWIASPGPRVRDLTLAELQRFDVGAIKPGTEYAKQFSSQAARPGTKMPTLAEIAGLPGRFNIETKISPLAPDDTLDPETFARTLIAEIRRLGLASRATIQSFDWRTLAIVARDAPEIARAYLTTERGAKRNRLQGQGRFTLDRDRRRTTRQLDAARGESGGRGHLVAVLARCDARDRRRSQSFGAYGDPVDGQRPGRHGALDRYEDRRADHRLSRSREGIARFARDRGALANAIRLAVRQCEGAAAFGSDAP